MTLLIIISLITVAIGLGLAVIVSWLMIEPVLQIMRSRKGDAAPKSKPNSVLRKADTLIEKGQLDDALKVLRKGFQIKTPRDELGIQRLKELNRNIISRVLIIAEEKGGRAEHIGDVEHSLIQRIELLNLLVRANESFRNLRSRREKAGKEFPSWGRSDFESRIKEIKAELAVNEKKLSEELEKLFSAIKNFSAEDKPVTYH